MQMIFKPTIALLNRLKYPQKFVLISLLFVLPMAYVQNQYSNEVGANILIAQNEFIGTAYLRPLYRLLHRLPQIESSPFRLQQASAASQDRAKRVNALVDADMAALYVASAPIRSAE